MTPLAPTAVEARVNSTEVHCTSTIREIRSVLICLNQVHLSDRTLIVCFIIPQENNLQRKKK